MRVKLVGWIQLACQQNRPGKPPPTRALGPDLTWRRDDVRAFCPIDADTFRLDPREDTGRAGGRRGPRVSSVLVRGEPRGHQGLDRGLEMNPREMAVARQHAPDAPPTERHDPPRLGARHMATQLAPAWRVP